MEEADDGGDKTIEEDEAVQAPTREPEAAIPGMSMSAMEAVERERALLEPTVGREEAGVTKLTADMGAYEMASVSVPTCPSTTTDTGTLGPMPGGAIQRIAEELSQVVKRQGRPPT